MRRLSDQGTRTDDPIWQRRRRNNDRRRCSRNEVRSRACAEQQHGDERELPHSGRHSAHMTSFVVAGWIRHQRPVGHHASDLDRSDHTCMRRKGDSPSAIAAGRRENDNRDGDHDRQCHKDQLHQPVPKASIFSRIPAGRRRLTSCGSTRVLRRGSNRRRTLAPSRR